MALLTQTLPCTVTVVDDEPHALDVLVRAARSWRYECQSAANAEQAITLLEKNPTPIVVTDLRMPGRGGIWLVRQIQQRWPEIFTIVVTAGQDEDAVNECLRAGAHHYFLKPIKLDEFRHALESTLRNHFVYREKERYRKRLELTVRRQTRKIRRTYLSAIEGLVFALEARDRYTIDHSRRVRHHSLLLARAIGLNRLQRKRLSLAAKLHDIGKVGVAEAILNKPGKLSADEYLQIKEHPGIGVNILRKFIRNADVLTAVRGHHERFDGSGYPDGLRGNQIPFLARLISVADCFDALTSSRPYRQALSPDDALDEIGASAGSYFDPELAPVFIRIMRGSEKV